MKLVLVETIEGDYECAGYDDFHTFELESEDASVETAKALLVQGLVDRFNEVNSSDFSFHFFHYSLSTYDVLSWETRNELSKDPELIKTLVFQDLKNLRILTLDEWFEENRIV